jgi:hypothetical protein
MDDEQIEIEQVAYHRNGISGIGFHVVTFTAAFEGEKPREMVGVVFPYPYDEENDGADLMAYRRSDNPCTAVFDRKLLGEGVIAFGANSWRGDRYDKDLRDAIVAAL